jgi:hypothetical protein
MVGMRLHRFCLAGLAGLLAAAAVGPAAASAAEQSFTLAGEHAFTVPAGVTSMQVTLVGGRGGAGNANGGTGGSGATVRATLAVSPGQTLMAQVAGDGRQSGAGGYGGGGAGGPVVALFAGAPGGGGGGGASAVRACPSAGCSPLVVAGGGGGGGGAGLDTTPTISGGNGGADSLSGSAGEDDLSKHDAGGTGGKAGSQSAGGAAGENSYETPATNGRLAVGGDGGTSIGGGGGGGGGGMFGGGGGGGGDGFADFNTLQFFSGAGGGGGGGSSGVPAGGAGVSGYSLLPTADGAEPSVAFTWTTTAPAAVAGDPVTTTSASSPVAELAPVVGALRLSRARFRRGTRRARLARVATGTTVTFTLSAAARVRFTFERAVRGGIGGRRCRTATRALRRRPRCTRFSRMRGAVRLTLPAGTDHIRFDGVLDSGRRLAVGRYRLSVVAVDAAGRASPARRAWFNVVS